MFYHNFPDTEKLLYHVWYIHRARFYRSWRCHRKGFPFFGNSSSLQKNLFIQKKMISMQYVQPGNMSLLRENFSPSVFKTQSTPRRNSIGAQDLANMKKGTQKVRTGCFAVRSIPLHSDSLKPSNAFLLLCLPPIETSTAKFPGNGVSDSGGLRKGRYRGDCWLGRRW